MTKETLKKANSIIWDIETTDDVMNYIKQTDTINHYSFSDELRKELLKCCNKFKKRREKALSEI
jgi:hypothetical protein